jgi:hypothetical protein
MKHEFSKQILEKNKILNLMKTPPVGEKLFHEDRQRNGQT